VSGSTINSALAIPREVYGNLAPLLDQKKTLLRVSLSELKLIIIDEISMVSNNKLLHIHQRLNGFNYGQIYVALSRATPLHGVQCLEHLTNNLLEQTHESTMNTEDLGTRRF